MDRKPSTLASNVCFNGSTSTNSKDDHDNNNKSLEKRDCNDKAENKIVGFFCLILVHFYKLSIVEQ